MEFLISVYFNSLYTIATKLINFVTMPISIVLANVFPDLRNTVSEVVSTIYGVFDYIVWPLSWLPEVFINSIIFILGLEIIYLTVNLTVYVISKSWYLIQKFHL